VMAWLDPAEWSFEQRAAVAGDLDQQLAEVIGRLAKLSRDLLTEISVAEYLVSRKLELRLDEDEIQF